MFSVETALQIDASPRDVFAFVDDPQNHVKITPSLVDVENVRDLAGGGKRAEYTYKLAGVKLTGSVRDVERDPPTRLVQQLSGAIEGTVRFAFEGEAGGTAATYEAEYELPNAVLDTIARPVATAYNRREAEVTLANLKSHVEA